MHEQFLTEIKSFLENNSEQKNIDTLSRYFKDNTKFYGVDKDVIISQRDKWIETQISEFSINECLDLCDILIESEYLEEKHLAIGFLESKKSDFSENVFERLSAWFPVGVNNWATTDVLCMSIISVFLTEEIITKEKLANWNNSESEWQRRITPVALNELIKKGLTPDDTFPYIENLMLDKSEYVQKGIGTLLRGLWKKYPNEIETFLLQWKDQCGRLIIQYATEKMDKEHRKKFRKTKK